MNGYVLIRDDGAYVAMPGQESSYTRDLRDARIFPTREAAEAERCVENERVENVESQLRGRPI